MSPNKQLQRPGGAHRGDAARAPFHYARASRSHWRRAAAELRRYAVTPMRGLVAIGVFMASGVAAQEFGAPMENGAGISAATKTSIPVLLASPTEWDGKAVSISGFLHSEIHGVFLFETSEHCESFESAYAVGVTLSQVRPELSWTSLPMKDCLRATVSGVFVSTPPEPHDESAIVIGIELAGEVDAQHIVFNKE